MKDDRKSASIEEERRETLRMTGELVGTDGELYARGSYAFTKYQREQREKAAAAAALAAAKAAKARWSLQRPAALLVE